jgi:hypothetical protein
MSKLSLVGAMIMLLKEKPPDVRPSGCWVINSKPDPVVELFFGRDRLHRPADLFGRIGLALLDLPRRLVLQAATADLTPLDNSELRPHLLAEAGLHRLGVEPHQRRTIDTAQWPASI